MGDKPKIAVGLVIALVVLTVPFWYTLGASKEAAPPDLELPKDANQCVEDKAYMTANHMDLLNRWRDAVVREGETTYVSKADGKRYEMSLEKTCMRCHDNRQTFCHRCHSYADVSPTCWDCHVEPKPKGS